MYIPEYVSQAPWYVEQGNKDDLHHQRKEDRDKQWDSIDKHYIRGAFVGQATKYRKGACKNCGSMTHTEKDCFYAPRKRGAYLTNKDIMPDEYINKELNLSYEGKRDRWNGVDVRSLRNRQRMLLDKADEERRRLHADEVNSKFMTEPDGDHRRYYNSVITKEQKDREKLVDDGEQLDVHISDSDDSDDSDIADLNAVDSSKKRVEYDSKIKTSVRDMRIREDTAHYLLNLDDDSAYYDPRTRSMRGNPYQKSGKNPNEVPYAGENFVRASGEVSDFRKTQIFAWEASMKESNVHMEAQPTATALLQKQVEERKKQLEEMRKKKLEQRYGVSLGKSKEIPIVQENENYVEYDKKGNIVKGLPEAIPKSKYEEDLYPGNHKSVWGSWYSREEGKWGYACCHQCVKNAYCLAGQI